MNNKTQTSPSSSPSIELEPVTAPGVAPAGATGLIPTLAVGVTPIDPPVGVEAGLRERLLTRVARSASASRVFETVRLSDGVWRELAPGVRARSQHADAASQTTLIELAPGAVWRIAGGAPLHGPAWPATRAAHECLVLRGEVRIDVPAWGSPTLSPQDYRLIGTDAPGLADASMSAAQGALLYWRTSAAGTSEFGETCASHAVAAGEAGWEPLRQGVKIKPLHQAGERISMLVQFEPGARVPDHPHALGEECLMVQGELFLGDVLLREGEFQFAPSGSSHGELFSDVGCMLFFSGAIDPSAIDPAVRVRPM